MNLMNLVRAGTKSPPVGISIGIIDIEVNEDYPNNLTAGKTCHPCQIFPALN